MMIFDLKKSMLNAASVHDTEQNPFDALATLADRSIAMMMVYNLDDTTLAYLFISHDPNDRKHITVEASNPVRAFELAQAEYQRDTGPTQAVQ